MSGYFYIRFINFVPKVKILSEYTKLFFPKKYKNNYKTILKHFDDNFRL